MRKKLGEKELQKKRNWKLRNNKDKKNWRFLILLKEKQMILIFNKKD